MLPVDALLWKTCACMIQDLLQFVSGLLHDFLIPVRQPQTYKYQCNMRDIHIHRAEDSPRYCSLKVHLS